MGSSTDVTHLVVLGSTGSIGTQTLDIVRHQPGLRVFGLAGGANLTLLARQVDEFRPSLVSFRPEAHLKPEAAHRVEYCSMEEMAAAPEADVVVVATAGIAGLGPTLAALRAGKRVALANKEVLVMAGPIIRAVADEYGGTLLPVDSEHSAVWQCLAGEGGLEAGIPSVRRITLTASGGAFRDLDEADLAGVTPEQALRHPTWKMGPKVTVDSATLMNKGFEVIEARWLFGCRLDQIGVVLHRESLVHALVEFVDGSVKAQMGVPDMRLPIQYALTYPRRLACPVQPLGFDTALRLSFEPLPQGRYPCLDLALQAARAGGTAPAVLNAADEVAVGEFLRGRIGFTDIYRLVAGALDRHPYAVTADLNRVLEADAWARRHLSDKLALERV